MKTVVRLLVGACVAAALALWLGPPLLGWVSSRMAGPTPASPGSSTPYYVVKSPVDGRPEYLYDVAVRTLGDGNRYREIFELNRDRIQPDGGRLTDITDLRPGWILLLPGDATGASVRVGEPPSGADGRAASEPLLPTAALLAVLVGLGVVALATRAVVARRSPGGRVAAALARAPGGSGQGTDRRLPPPVDPFSGPIAVPDARTVLASLTRLAPPADAAAVATPVADLPSLPLAIAPEPVPNATAPVSFESFEGEVSAGAGDWQVRLTGVRIPADTPAWRWLSPTDDPAGVMPVVLGNDGELRLCVDLAQAPSTFTITGPIEVCREQVRRIMAQLRAAGRTVVVVGDVLGQESAVHDRQVTTFPDDVANLPPGIVVTAGLEPGDLPTARGLATRTQGRTVTVVIGPVLRATWSMSAKPST